MSADRSAPHEPEPGFIQILRALDRWLAKFEEISLAAVLLLLIFVGSYQALNRNFFPPAAAWPDAILRWCVFYIGMIAAAMATQSNRHINIDMVARFTTPKGRMVLRILSSVFTIFVMLFLFRAGLRTREAVAMDQPMHTFDLGFSITPVGIWDLFLATCLLMVFHLLVRLIADCHALATGRLPRELIEYAPSE